MDGIFRAISSSRRKKGRNVIKHGGYIKIVGFEFFTASFTDFANSSNVIRVTCGRVMISGGEGKKRGGALSRNDVACFLSLDENSKIGEREREKEREREREEKIYTFQEDNTIYPFSTGFLSRRLA